MGERSARSSRCSRRRNDNNFQQFRRPGSQVRTCHFRHTTQLPLHQTSGSGARQWCHTLGRKVIISRKFLTVMLCLLIMIPCGAGQRTSEVDLAILVALGERCALLDPISAEVYSAALNALAMKIGIEKIKKMKKLPHYTRALQDSRIALKDRDLNNLIKECSSLRDYKNELNK